jgi:PHP family Zn ribbon phosphoesterase
VDRGKRPLQRSWDRDLSTLERFRELLREEINRRLYEKYRELLKEENEETPPEGTYINCTEAEKKAKEKTLIFYGSMSSLRDTMKTTDPEEIKQHGEEIVQIDIGECQTLIKTLGITKPGLYLVENNKIVKKIS